MKLFDFLKKMFERKAETHELDNFIVRNNPQSVADIDVLTRRFYEQNSASWSKPF